MSLALIVLAAMAPLTAQTAPTVASLRWDKRVLLISVPTADAAVVAQRRMAGEIGERSDDRDLVLVEVIGDKVRGVSDTAAALRRNYRLPADRFTTILIGKDGGEKLRSETPISSSELIETIDAMPMRRSGER